MKLLKIANALSNNDFNELSLLTDAVKQESTIVAITKENAKGKINLTAARGARSRLANMQSTEV